MTTIFTVDPARVRAYDQAYAAACAAEGAANVAARELTQERRALVNEIERKAAGKIRASEDDFLARALKGGFATREIIDRIKKLDTEIAAGRERERASSDHRQRLNDPVFRVRQHVGRPA